MGKTHKSETASAPRRTKKRYQEFQPSKDLIQLSEAMKRKREYELDTLTKQEAEAIKTVNKVKLTWKERYLLYLVRWAVLAIPGAWLLILTQKIIPNLYVAMVVSQIMTGAGVFFLDRKILKG